MSSLFTICPQLSLSSVTFRRTSKKELRRVETRQIVVLRMSAAAAGSRAPNSSSLSELDRWCSGGPALAASPISLETELSLSPTSSQTWRAVTLYQPSCCFSHSPFALRPSILPLSLSSFARCGTQMDPRIFRSQAFLLLHRQQSCREGPDETGLHCGDVWACCVENSTSTTSFWPVFLFVDSTCIFLVHLYRSLIHRPSMKNTVWLLLKWFCHMFHPVLYE